jgi:hypothetical protein
MVIFWTDLDCVTNPNDQWVAVTPSGQLGNQLWMIASSYGIARAHNAHWCMEFGQRYAHSLELVVPAPSSCPCLFPRTALYKQGWYITSMFKSIGSNDYYAKLWHTGNVIPPVEYYKQAISLLKHIWPDEHVFVVLSDDPEWVKRQDIFKGAHILSSADPAFDMAVISQCRHKILEHLGGGRHSWKILATT